MCCASFYGANIDFELPESLVAQAFARLGAIVPSPPSGPAVVSYRIAEVGGTYSIVRFDPSRFDAPTPIGVTVDDIVDDLHLTIAMHATAGVFVHAGVVAWRGRVIVIPGRSMSGKSTLVAALVDRGATYFSDEFAIIDGGGLVRSYPRCLSLRTVGGRRQIDPATFTSPESDTLPVGVIVSTTYHEGRRFDPIAMRRSQACLAVVEHTVLALSDPQSALRAASAISRQAVAVGGIRGEADQAAERILRLVDAVDAQGCTAA